MIILAGERFRKNVGKTFHMSVIFHDITFSLIK